MGDEVSLNQLPSVHQSLRAPLLLPNDTVTLIRDLHPKADNITDARTKKGLQEPFVSKRKIRFAGDDEMIQ
jgi:hypothetical protein